MAFMSDKATRMSKSIHAYLRAWQLPTRANEHHLIALLRTAVHPSGMTFHADGVVHTDPRHKTIEELAAHILERHAAYTHLVHEEFASAVDEGSNLGFLGVRFVMQNVGSVAGQPPSGRPTEGALLERLELDKQGFITAALVCRQMTVEEVQALTHDPSAVHPPPLDDEQLYAPPEELGAADIQAMRRAAEAWVHSWDADADVDVLYEILSPEVVQVSGYGLSRRRVPFVGAEQAKAAVLGSLQKYPGNTDQLLGLAICNDRRAGFMHWRSTSALPSSGSPESQEGLEYMRFDTNNRISFILSFTMRPYSNVRHESAARRDHVD